MSAQFKQSVALLIAFISLLFIRNPLMSLSVDLYRILAGTCFLWVVVGPAVAVLRGNRDSRGVSRSLAQTVIELIAGIVMNVAVVFVIVVLIAASIGNQGANL